MAVDHLLTQPVTVRHRDPAAVDAYGDRTVTTASSTATLAYIEQTEAVEVLVGQQTYRSDWLLWLGSTDTIDETDQVVRGAEIFEVIGDPWPVWNPRRRALSHYHARLRKVTG